MRATTSLRTKLILSFALLTLFSITIGCLSLWALSETNHRLSRMVEEGQRNVELATSMSAEVRIGVETVMTMMLVTEQQHIDAAMHKGEASKKRFFEARQRLTELVKAGPKAAALANALFDADNVAVKDFEKFIEIAKTGDKAQSGKWLSEHTGPSMQALQDAILRLKDHFVAENASLRSDSQSFYGQVKLLVLLSFGLSTAVGIGLAHVISTTVSNALGAEPGDLSNAVARVASGELSCALRVRSGDTTSVLANVSRMQASLAAMVSAVRQNAEGVATASAEIAQGNQDLSQRTEEQSSALQQAASTMVNRPVFHGGPLV